jgi:hypothetical protein
MSIVLQVFFDDPFWVGLFALSENNSIKYCRVVFGKEPSDAELYNYLLKNYYRLKFTESESTIQQKSVCDNPKRRQRQISKELHNNTGVKKSYEIVKQSLTQSSRKAKRAEQREKKETQVEYVMNLKRIKHREKHKGH